MRFVGFLVSRCLATSSAPIFFMPKQGQHGVNDGLSAEYLREVLGTRAYCEADLVERVWWWKHLPPKDHTKVGNLFQISYWRDVSYWYECQARVEQKYPCGLPFAEISVLEAQGYAKGLPGIRGSLQDPLAYYPLFAEWPMYPAAEMVSKPKLGHFSLSKYVDQLIIMGPHNSGLVRRGPNWSRAYIVFFNLDVPAKTTGDAVADLIKNERRRQNLPTVKGKAPDRRKFEVFENWDRRTVLKLTDDTLSSSARRAGSRVNLKLISDARKRFAEMRRRAESMTKTRWPVWRPPTNPGGVLNNPE